MKERGTPLRLAFCQRLGGHLEICNNSFEQGIPVFYDNGCVKTLTFNNCACRTNSKAIRVGIFFEPCKKQTVAIGLAPVTVIAHIEQYVKMFLEELIQDSQNSFLNLWIMGRAYAFSFLYDKLKRITASNLTLFFERIT